MIVISFVDFAFSHLPWDSKKRKDVRSSSRQLLKVKVDSGLKTWEKYSLFFKNKTLIRSVGRAIYYLLIDDAQTLVCACVGIAKCANRKGESRVQIDWKYRGNHPRRPEHALNGSNKLSNWFKWLNQAKLNLIYLSSNLRCEETPLEYYISIFIRDFSNVESTELKNHVPEFGSQWGNPTASKWKMLQWRVTQVNEYVVKSRRTSER
jgi:hypothetical protein